MFILCTTLSPEAYFCVSYLLGIPGGFPTESSFPRLVRIKVAELWAWSLSLSCVHPALDSFMYRILKTQAVS